MHDRQKLEAELRECNDSIDRAYWNFTRQKRAKPPVLVVPEAYQRRKEIQEILRSLRLIEPQPGCSPVMHTTKDFKVGEKVLFGRSFGEKTLGEVVKINRAKLKVKQLDARGTFKSHPVGTVWTVPPSLCTKTDASGSPVPEAPKPKRSEAEIMQNIRRLYSQLSPENLHCDGEISRTQAARRGAAFRRELNECFRELGRRVSESEAYRNVG